MNKALSPWLLSLATLATFGLVGCGGNGGDSTPAPAANEFRIGGLFSLTGNWNTLGKASKAAVELAESDVNAYFKSRGIVTRVKVVVSDTKLDGAQALKSMNSLAAGGAHVFIGPQSSSEVAALKANADSTGSILISQGSTASSLSIADDNVFRMVPDDVREAKALVALAQADGIQAIVPVARQDAGNDGLFNSVTARFTEAGGTLGTGVRYSTSTTDFAATLASIKASVQALQATHSNAQIGVYLAGFDEVASILAGIGSDPVLSAVKWYGSDGVAQSAALTSNAATANGSISVGFPNPIFGLDDGMVGTWSPISQRIKAKSGVDPDAFALSAYDAVWLAALAHENAGSTWNAATFRTALMSTADGYTGVTGPTKFDASGDRNTGNFDFWGIASSGSSFVWKRVAVYRATDGAIVRTP